MDTRKTQTQWSPETAAPDVLPGVEEEVAPPPDPAPSQAAHQAASADGAIAAPPPPADDPPPSLWHDIPVASVLPPPATLLPPSPAVPSPLEDRLYRLEAELAQLRSVQPPAPPDPSTSVVRQPGGFWRNVGKRFMAPSGPAAAAPPTAPPRADSLASMIPPGVRRGWVWLDGLRELRAMYCMFFDPRYRLSWFGRLAPLLIVFLILTSWLWMPGVGLPGVGWIIDKFADLILAYLLFKLLCHEARRYRETAPDLPPNLRL